MAIDKSILDLLGVHIIFAVVTAALLLLPLGLSINVLLLVAVVFYNVLIPMIAKLRNHEEWLEIWIFVAMLSVLQIFPDWFLAEGLGVLNFIDKSPPMVGAVPLYMGGLWAIPLFVIVYTGSRARETRGETAGYFVVAILSLAVFGLAEATMWMLGSWETLAQVVVANVALYILVPEVILGLTALSACEESKSSGLPTKLLAALRVMVIYIGNASLFYLIVEVLL